MKKSLFAALAAIALATTPVAAQSVPPAGPSGGLAASWGSMPLGSYVMIGGAVFIVTGVGLMLADEESTTTPQPAPATSTSSTSG